MKTIFIIFSFLPSILLAQVECDLYTIVDSVSANGWRADTLGLSGGRNQFYNSYFYHLYKGLEKISLKGKNVACIQSVFGKPNKIIKRDATHEVHIYFIRGFIGYKNGKQEHTGEALEIEYSNGVVLSYSIMIDN